MGYSIANHRPKLSSYAYAGAEPTTAPTDTA
eukprot:COSAG06_NODE_42403_length_382_cov_0.547703_1_plen_30_part_01